MLNGQCAAYWLASPGGHPESTECGCYILGTTGGIGYDGGVPYTTNGGFRPVIKLKADYKIVFSDTNYKIQ